MYFIKVDDKVVDFDIDPEAIVRKLIAASKEFAVQDIEITSDDPDGNEMVTLIRTISIVIGEFYEQLDELNEIEQALSDTVYSYESAEPSRTTVISRSNYNAVLIQLENMLFDIRDAIDEAKDDSAIANDWRNYLNNNPRTTTVAL